MKTVQVKGGVSSRIDNKRRPTHFKVQMDEASKQEK